VTIFLKNVIVSSVKIQIYLNSLFWEIKNQENFVKRLEQVLSRLVQIFFKNNIVSLVKIQIYSIL
jgi:hypothetical protein